MRNTQYQYRQPATHTSTITWGWDIRDKHLRYQNKPCDQDIQPYSKKQNFNPSQQKPIKTIFSPTPALSSIIVNKKKQERNSIKKLTYLWRALEISVGNRIRNAKLCQVKHKTHQKTTDSVVQSTSQNESQHSSSKSFNEMDTEIETDQEQNGTTWTKKL